MAGWPSFQPFLFNCEVVQLVRRWRSAEIADSSRDAAMARRAAEFQAGRDLARESLAAIGSQCTLVGRRHDRSPIWPQGFVGSIAHSGPFVGVSVARGTVTKSIGIDIEIVTPANANALLNVQVVSERELSLLDSIPLTRAYAATICFSAKEAAFKCLHPVLGSSISFEKLEVASADLSSGSLSLSVLDSSQSCCGLSLQVSIRRCGVIVFASTQF